MSNPWVHVERGHVILRPNGRMLDDFLYCDREVAQSIIKELFPECSVAPARRVSSLRRNSTTTAVSRVEIIVDREAT